jgi:hypothetical protein
MKIIRKKIKTILPVLALFLIVALILSRVFNQHSTDLIPEASIETTEAAFYIGSVMEVCGNVVSVETIFHLRGEPTFINFGRPHPYQEFTAVLWAQDRNRNTFPEKALLVNRRVCVSGKIEDHNGTPQIRIRKPIQIAIQ